MTELAFALAELESEGELLKELASEVGMPDCGSVPGEGDCCMPGCGWLGMKLGSQPVERWFSSSLRIEEAFL
jgi:hypothetical protein